MGIVSFISSKINDNISAIYSACVGFLGYAKKVGIFLGRQILKLGFLWV